MQAQAEVRELMGMGVTDANGTKVGTIKQVYLNDDTGAPEWVTVHTGWFGMRESFVPLSGASKEDDTLRVPYAKEAIKGAPNVNADEHLSHAQIVDLYRHYGVRPPGGRRTGEDGSEKGTDADREAGRGEGERAEGGSADSDRATDATESPGTTESASTGKSPGTPAAAGKAGAAGAAGMAVHPEKGGRKERQAMPPQTARDGAEAAAHDGADAPMTEITRSEEQLRVGTERYEAGRVRVRRWVETETVERTIPVSHEEIRIDREPITGGEPSPGASLSEDEQEIILYEERPVVTKETVPVERIRIRTDRVQDEQTVRGEIRKERVEVTRDEPSREDAPRGEAPRGEAPRGGTPRDEGVRGDGQAGEGKAAGRHAAGGARGRSPA